MKAREMRNEPSESEMTFNSKLRPAQHIEVRLHTCSQIIPEQKKQFVHQPKFEMNHTFITKLLAAYSCNLSHIFQAYYLAAYSYSSLSPHL